MNFLAAVREVALASPSRPALEDGELRLDYDQLWSLISRTSAWYRSQGLAPGDRVLVWLPNGVSFVAAHFGALAAGLVSVPMKAENGPHEVALALAETEPRLIVSEESLLERARDLRWPAPLRLVTELPLSGDSLDLAPEPVAPNHPASLNYSYYFGEGRPHAAVLSHANYLNAGIGYAAFHRIVPEDRTLVVLPMPHVFTLGGALLASFLSGASVIVCRALRPRSLLDALVQTRATRFPCIPQVMLALADYYDPTVHDLRLLKYFVSGADYLPIATHRRIEEALGVTVVQGYGLTECFPITCSPPGERNRPGTLGVAGHAEVRLRTVDDTGHELAPGNEGEIEIASPTVMSGYWRAPEATARVLHDGWLRTGDRGHIDGDGYLHFAGMLKPIVNLNGNKVDMVEVARVVAALPGVAAAEVTARMSDGGLLREVMIEAHVRLAPGATVSEKDVRQHCRRYLASYKVPGAVVVEAAPVATHPGGDGV